STTTFTTPPTSLDDMVGTLNNDVGFKANYVASATPEGKLLVTSKTLGTTSPAIPAPGGAGVAVVADSAKAGTTINDGISLTSTNGTTGTYLTEVDAASHKISVTYGTKSADINIVGRDGTVFKENNQLQLINDQLKAAGINDVTASFDAEGKLA